MTLHPACIPALGPAFSALIRRSSSSDTSAEVLADTSPEASGDTCGWCGSGIRGRRDARWCSRRCRQAAFRCRRLSRRHQLQATPLRMAYADPKHGRKFLGCDLRPSQVALSARRLAEVQGELWG